MLSSVFAVGLLSLIPLLPPDPLPATASSEEFSADRASEHIERIAERPRPSGTPAAADTRAYLTGELEDLGLEPEVLTATVERDLTFTPHVVGNVANVHAVLPGTGDGGRVLLVAHYDSVPIGPGATDNGMGVAILLEVARALTEGPAPYNDVEFLFTDAEESGQLGARAFTLDPEVAGDPDRTVVLNMEARGTKGPALMFEAGDRAGAFVPALAESTPFAGSFSDGVYRVLPNNTDFTVFSEAGYTGMNFVILGGSARYDTPLDDLGSLDARSLQDMGDTALATTAALTERDPALEDGGDITYLTVFGVLVHYPIALAYVLGAFAVVGTVAALWFTRRAGLLSLAEVLRTAAGYTVPLAVAAGLGVMAWWSGVAVRPHFENFPFGDTYRPAPVLVGLVLLTLVTCGVWAGRVRRRRGDPALLAGALVWFCALTVILTVAAPEAAYLFTWPAMAGAAGLALAARTEEGSPPRSFALAAGALVSMVLFPPVVALLFPTVGLALAPVVLVVLVLALLPLMPQLGRCRGRRPSKVVTGAVATAAVVVIAVGFVVDGVDEEHPAQYNLHYVYDDDTGRAVWLSPNAAGSPWLDQYVVGEPQDVEDTFPALYLPEGYRSGPAPVVGLPIPRAEVIDSHELDDDLREVRVRLTAGGERTTVLSLYSTTGPDRLERVAVDGVALSTAVNRPDTHTGWDWGFHFVAPGDGVDLTLVVRGEEDLPLRLLAYTADVPRDALGDPKPATVTWSAGGFGRGIAAVTSEV